MVITGELRGAAPREAGDVRRHAVRGAVRARHGRRAQDLERHHGEAEAAGAAAGAALRFVGRNLYDARQL